MKRSVREDPVAILGGHQLAGVPGIARRLPCRSGSPPADHVLVKGGVRSRVTIDVDEPIARHPWQRGLMSRPRCQRAGRSGRRGGWAHAHVGPSTRAATARDR
jgi:hypothetical protein